MLTVALPTCTTDELAIVLPTAAVPLTNICAVVIPTLAPTLILLTKSTAPVIAAPSDDIVNLPPNVDVVVTFNTFVFVVAAASILAVADITPVDVSVPDVFAFVNEALCHLLVLFQMQCYYHAMALVQMNLYLQHFSVLIYYLNQLHHQFE